MLTFCVIKYPPNGLITNQDSRVRYSHLFMDSRMTEGQQRCWSLTKSAITVLSQELRLDKKRHVRHQSSLINYHKQLIHC